MVEVWSWIIGYAVLFAVVQLAIYAYYVRRGETNPQASAIGDPEEYTRVGDRVQRDPVDEDDLADPEPASHASEESVRSCPHCGTPNERLGTVKYCRHCTRSLG